MKCLLQVRMPASVQRLNESKDVIKYWKHDMSCMKMICDYKVHREPLSTVGEFIIGILIK